MRVGALPVGGLGKTDNARYYLIRGRTTGLYIVLLPALCDLGFPSITVGVWIFLNTFLIRRL